MVKLPHLKNSPSVYTRVDRSMKVFSWRPVLRYDLRDLMYNLVDRKT